MRTPPVTVAAKARKNEADPLARGRQPDVAAATELDPDYHADPDLEVGVVHPGALLAVLGPALRREQAAAGRAVQATSMACNAVD